MQYCLYFGFSQEECNKTVNLTADIFIMNFVYTNSGQIQYGRFIRALARKIADIIRGARLSILLASNSFQWFDIPNCSLSSLININVILTQ